MSTNHSSSENVCRRKIGYFYHFIMDIFYFVTSIDVIANYVDVRFCYDKLE